MPNPDVYWRACGTSWAFRPLTKLGERACYGLMNERPYALLRNEQFFVPHTFLNPVLSALADRYPKLVIKEARD